MRRQFIKGLPPGVILLGMLLGFVLPVVAQEQTVVATTGSVGSISRGGIANGEFEQGAMGQPPPGWFVGSPLPDSGDNRAAYAAQTTGVLPWRGWYCGCLYTVSTPAIGQFGSLSQSISARAFRGKPIRLRAQLRVERAPNARIGGANLFLRIDRANNSPLLLTKMARMGGKLAYKPVWKPYEIDTVLPADTETIHLGTMLVGEGRVYIDSVTMDVNGTALAKIRPLRVKTNLVKTPVVTVAPPSNNPLPSNSENPTTSDPPIAPTELSTAPQTNNGKPIKVVKVRALPNADFEKGKIGQVPPGWFLPLAQRRAGFGAKITEGGPNTGNKCAMLYRNPKVKLTDTRLFANLMQTLDAAPLRGKRIRYRAWVRVLPKTAKDRAQLWMRIDKTDGTVGFIDLMEKRPIRSSQWQAYEIVADVTDDAKTVNLGVIFARDGKAFVDNVSLNIIGDAVKPGTTPVPQDGNGQ